MTHAPNDLISIDESGLFPVKRSSLLLAICLSLINYNIYAIWWFLSRRKSLNQLPTPQKMSRPILWIYIVLTAISVTSLVGSVLFIQLANLHLDSGYYAIAALLHLLQLFSGVIGAILLIVQSFKVKSILESSQKKSPFSQSLSGFATFIFGVLYLQYRINQHHKPAKNTLTDPSRFSSEPLCISLSSLAVFTTSFISIFTFIFIPPIIPNENIFYFLIILAIFATKLITDQYAGNWITYAERAPAFLIIAFLAGLYFGSITANQIKQKQKSVLSETTDLQITTSSQATDLVERPRYTLDNTTHYRSTVRTRNGKTEWVVWVTSGYYSQRYVIDAKTGEIISPKSD